MNTAPALSLRSARLAWLGSILVMLLQRTPVLRLLVAAEEMDMGGRAGQMLRALIPVAAGIGAVNTLTGATKFTANPVSPATATSGTAVAIAFAVTGAPSTTKCYSIDGTLPAGLSVPGATVSGTQRTLNASAGSISGTPTGAGSFTVQIKAWEKTGRGGNSSPSYNYTINVSGGSGTVPAFSTQPASQTVTAGSSVTISVVATGSPAPTLQWRKGGANISGKTSASLSLPNVATTDAGSYDCVATNSAGSATSSTATLTVNAATTTPVFTTQPASQSVTAGASVTFTIAASGSPPPTFQWRKGGANLSGKTGSTLTLASATTGDAGNYDCVATNSAGSATSNGATLSVNSGSAPAIILQPSPLTVLTGNAAYFGVQASGTGMTYQWKRNGIAIAGATQSTLMLTSVQASNAGNYTVTITDSLNQQTTSNPAVLTVATSGSSRLINMSTRTMIGASAGGISPGFVIEGSVAQTVLVRAVGPTLSGFGITDPNPDPTLTLYSGGTAIAANDNWDQAGNVAALSATTTSVGAFPLPGGSKDAALLITLMPGTYTIQIAGNSGATGEVLVELYSAGP